MATAEENFAGYEFEKIDFDFDFDSDFDPEEVNNDNSRFCFEFLSLFRILRFGFMLYRPR